MQDGCTCSRGGGSVAKNSYGRGAGVPMVCKSNEDQQAGLCHTQCNAGYHGIGPVCWQNSCQGDLI